MMNGSAKHVTWKNKQIAGTDDNAETARTEANLINKNKNDQAPNPANSPADLEAQKAQKALSEKQKPSRCGKWCIWLLVLILLTAAGAITYGLLNLLAKDDAITDLQQRQQLDNIETPIEKTENEILGPTNENLDEFMVKPLEPEKIDVVEEENPQVEQDVTELQDTEQSDDVQVGDDAVGVDDNTDEGTMKDSEITETKEENQDEPITSDSAQTNTEDIEVP